MTPLPVNPKLIVLLGEGNAIAAIATNIAPDVEVIVVTSGSAEFNELAKGQSFLRIVE